MNCSNDENKDKKPWYDEIRRHCPLLFDLNSGVYSCGFECGRGWFEPLRQLCYELETTNLQYYAKYRMRITALQIKEKFGTLRFYYQVIRDKPAWRRAMARFAVKLYCRIKSIADFRMKCVIDSQAWTETIEKELNKAEYVAAKYEYARCTNVFPIERDGRFFLIEKREHYEKKHFEPTRLKLLYRVNESIIRRLTDGQKPDFVVSAKHEMIRDRLDDLARVSVTEAERKCESRCEECGGEIGTSYNPRCETYGWVKYICQKCADSYGEKYKYYMNGILWSNGKIIENDPAKVKAAMVAKVNAQQKEAEDKQKRQEYCEALAEKDANPITVPVL